MAEHDETLEAGLVAGVDIPTALALSEQQEPPQRPRLGKGYPPHIAPANQGRSRSLRPSLGFWQRHVQRSSSAALVPRQKRSGD